MSVSPNELLLLAEVVLKNATKEAEWRNAFVGVSALELVALALGWRKHRTAFPAALVAAVAGLAGLGVMLIEVLARGNGLAAAGAVVGGAIWVGVPLGLLARVHDIGGPSAVLLLLGTVVVSDSSQYYTGRLLGRHLLAPTVSPKKTIEGALGGVVFGTAAMVLGGRWVLPYVGVPLLVGTGLAVVLLGICGDLFESRLKRLAGLKDSSSLIPGHGGVLDRIDALLFAAPAFYLLLGSSL